MSETFTFSRRAFTKLAILLGIFSSSIVAANLLGTKLTTFWGVAVSVGIFAYPLTFLVTDIVAEAHGKKIAKKFVWAGLLSQLLVLLLILVALALPAHERFAIESQYQEVFQQSARIIAASLVAFITSQSFDIWAFHRIRQKSKGKFLWLRNNASTMLSQLIDTFLFMYLAFWHAFPTMTTGFVAKLALTYWGFKVLFALIDTPFVYLGVRWLKKDIEETAS